MAWQRAYHARTVTGEHGRIDTRNYWLITEPEVLAYLDPKRRWPQLAGIGMVESERSASDAMPERR